MRILKPLTLTDAMLINSNIAEPAAGETPWDAGTTYALNDEVVRTTVHRRYRALANGTMGNPPPESNPTSWKDIGPTLRWAMFDNQVSTASNRAGPIVVDLQPGICGGIGLGGLDASSVQVTQLEFAGGPVVFDETFDLTATPIVDFYSYCFEPIRYRKLLLVHGLCPYLNSRITVTISGGAAVKCGMFLVGPVYEPGAVEYGVTAGIRSYSRKATDEETLETSFVRKGFKKDLEGRFVVPTGAINGVHMLMEELESVPCFWSGGGDMEPLEVIGAYRDFKLQVPYPSTSYYTFEIEGI
jgi:hypothetical protein